MIFSRRLLKLFGYLVAFLTVFNIIFYVKKSQIADVSPRILKVESNEKVSWEDVDFINYEKTRIGPGEHGDEVTITDEAELKINKEWETKEGFYVGVSNKISLTRALPDHRPEVCKNKKYYEKLPTVSVIVTFHNEIPSTLLRCVHSIYSRSPKELLHEILLINDNSTFPELYENLRKYVTETFHGKVKLHENKERQGLIKARMTGAKKATGDVLIFLDSHMEVHNTWLPPLLDEIVTNPNYATVPVSGGMHHQTLRPEHINYGHRGVFDWNFRYQWLPLRPQDKKVAGQPFETACLTGGYYAIRRDNFFRLGGYDEGLLIWNGENYELCIKLWLCGGGLLEIPCSQITHLSKTHSAYRNTEKPMDFVGRNLKRVAEVWLDEYKEVFYRGDYNRYKNLDAGDLTEQFERKKSLNCKPFSYFLEVVAPDMLERYPVNPMYFATGKIQSLSSNTCFGMIHYTYHEPVELVDCNRTRGVDYALTMEKSIRYNDTSDQCLDAHEMIFTNCHHQGGNQYFKFDLETRQIIRPNLGDCLTANATNNLITLTSCDKSIAEQRWKWTYENKTALMNWNSVGIKL